MTTLTDNTEAWERAASNATAYMHPADDQEGAGAIFWLGVAFVLGLGLGIVLPSVAVANSGRDNTTALVVQVV